MGGVIIGREKSGGKIGVTLEKGPFLLVFAQRERKAENHLAFAREKRRPSRQGRHAKEVLIPVRSGKALRKVTRLLLGEIADAVKSETKPAKALNHEINVAFGAKHERAMLCDGINGDRPGLIIEIYRHDGSLRPFEHYYFSAKPPIF